MRQNSPMQWGACYTPSPNPQNAPDRSFLGSNHDRSWPVRPKTTARHLQKPARRFHGRMPLHEWRRNLHKSNVRLWRKARPQSSPAAFQRTNRGVTHTLRRSRRNRIRRYAHIGTPRYTLPSCPTPRRKPGRCRRGNGGRHLRSARESSSTRSVLSVQGPTRSKLTWHKCQAANVTLEGQLTQH